MDTILNHWVKNPELVERPPTVALIWSLNGYASVKTEESYYLSIMTHPGSVLVCAEERPVGDTAEDMTPFKPLLFLQHFSETRITPQFFSFSAFHQPPIQRNTHAKREGPMRPSDPSPFVPRSAVPLQGQACLCVHV